MYVHRSMQANLFSVPLIKFAKYTLHNVTTKYTVRCPTFLIEKNGLFYSFHKGTLFGGGLGVYFDIYLVNNNNNNVFNFVFINQ